jgi:hypothetical protein
VDPFAVILLGGIAALVVFFVLLGRFYPGSGADVVDWRPTRSYEQRVAAEVEDLDQLLEATNARRRRRGERELTEHELHERVRADMTEGQRRRDAYLADQDVDELVAARNARRRKRGLPEMTREEVEAEIERRLQRRR